MTTVVGTAHEAGVERFVRSLYSDNFDKEGIVLDVPHNRFAIAGDAWARCRAGEADPMKFGIFDMLRNFRQIGNL